MVLRATAAAAASQPQTVSILSGMASSLFHSEYGWKTSHFWGPVANWGLVAAAMYDASFKGPDIIDISMTCVMIGYSSLFMWFALQVHPANNILFACHLFNVLAQLNQLRRAIDFRFEHNPNAWMELKDFARKVLLVIVSVVLAVSVSDRLQMALSQPSMPDFVLWAVKHPVGPFTIFFWAPLSKWAISGSYMLNLDRPTNTISTAQTTALTITGSIWLRYSMMMHPVNYNLAIVNCALSISSGYQLARKLKAEYDGVKSQ